MCPKHFWKFNATRICAKKLFAIGVEELFVFIAKLTFYGNMQIADIDRNRKAQYGQAIEYFLSMYQFDVNNKNAIRVLAL